MNSCFRWAHAALLGLPLLFAGQVQADPGDVFYVDHANTNGTRNGLSWNTAVTTIQEGIEIARRNFGGEVWVASGVYGENRENAGSLRLRSGVDVYGGFLGNESARSQRDVKAHITIVDGATANDGMAAASVVLGTDNTAFDGFTVRGGRGENGAGMRNIEVSPTVRNCTFTGNAATLFGGGMLNVDGANPVVQNCEFIGNEAGGSGGAVANTAASGDFQSCTFVANTAEVAGGAIFCTPDSDLVISGCRFEGNSAGEGGGGALFNDQIAPYIENSTFIGNSATSFGGAIFNNAADPLFVNVLFARNESLNQRGGAIVNLSSEMSAVNCTFSGNKAKIGGGAVFNNDASPSFLNCILWGDGPDEFSSVSSSVRVRFSTVQGGASGDGNTRSDPRFRDTETDDYRLLPDSPAIDQGSGNGAPEADILGVARPQGTGVDMGAYEATDIGTPAPLFQCFGITFVSAGIRSGGGGTGFGDMLVLASLGGILLAGALRRRTTRLSPC